MYVRGNPLRFNDPSGNCITLSDGTADLEGDAGCWSAAAEWAATYDTPLTSEYFTLATTTEKELRDSLCGYWCPLYTQWGVYHIYYNPPPIPNQPPVKTSRTEQLSKEYGDFLARCARTVNGACGISYGRNYSGVASTVKGSIDLYVDQAGEYAAYATVGAGPQWSFIPLDLAGESAVLVVGPGATLDDFGGVSMSMGGTLALGIGISADANVGLNGPYAGSGGVVYGVAIEAHATLNFSYVLHDSRDD